MQIHYSQLLYKIHSTGQIGSWFIKVEKGNLLVDALITRESRKILGGKPVVTPTHVTKGKNIGRSNETTALMQAISEAKSKVSKQIDKGYVVEMPQEGDKATNSLGFSKPMLAQTLNKVKKWGFPVYASTKMDGHRLLATVVEGQVVLYSRGGKVQKLEHIRSKLQEVFDMGRWDGTTLDGEVYCHGKTLQEISSLVKRPRPESCNLDYCVYDVLKTEVSYKYRIDYVQQITDIACSLYGANCVRKTPTLFIETPQELQEYHSQNLAAGFEGTMVRHGDKGYEEGKRSQSLLKLKDYQDDEFKILGFRTGKPYIKPEATYEVPVYVCKTSAGKSFECTAPGTMQEKHDQFENIEAQIGKILTVKFFNYTPDGAPFQPVALRFREDI